MAGAAAEVGGERGAVEGRVAVCGCGGTVRRDGFLKGLAVVGAAVVGGGWFGEGRLLAAARPSAAGDRDIFNFALLLEYLQASFYAEALAGGRLEGELKLFAEVVAAHEREHVRFLKRALGSRARPEPRFRFGQATREPRRFQSTAVALEDLAVAAYNGQAANLTRGGLAAAIKIVSVEGRHAAWIRDLAGQEPAPRAADPGADVAAVTAALRRAQIR